MTINNLNANKKPKYFSKNRSRRRSLSMYLMGIRDHFLNPPDNGYTNNDMKLISEILKFGKCL